VWPGDDVNLLGLLMEMRQAALGGLECGARECALQKVLTERAIGDAETRMSEAHFREKAIH